MIAPERSDHPTRPARWCDDHQRWECARQRSKGRGTCHGLAVSGLAACRMHAGMSGALAKAKGEALSAFSALSGEVVIDPKSAVMAVLQMTWIRLHIYAGMLAEQLEDGGSDSHRGAHGDGPILEVGLPGETGGIIGYTFGPAGVTGEAPRGLVGLEAAERDKVVKYAKTAHDMGIAEWQVKIAQTQAEQLAEVLMLAFADPRVTVDGDSGAVILDALSRLEVTA